MWSWTSHKSLQTSIMISEPKWKNIGQVVCLRENRRQRQVVRRSSISPDADDGDCSALAVIDSVKRRSISEMRRIKATDSFSIERLQRLVLKLTGQMSRIERNEQFHCSTNGQFVPISLCKHTTSTGAGRGTSGATSYSLRAESVTRNKCGI